MAKEKLTRGSTIATKHNLHYEWLCEGFPFLANLIHSCTLSTLCSEMVLAVAIELGLSHFFLLQL